MKTKRSSEETQAEPSWVPLEPTLIKDAEARRVLRRVVRTLIVIQNNDLTGQRIAEVRSMAPKLAETHCDTRFAAELILCINVLCDLRSQGWRFRLDKHSIAAQAPHSNGATVLDDKARVRAAHLIERDAQLRQPTVQRFVREMEKPRIHRGKWHSIFSLIRDGRELAEKLEAANAIPAGTKRRRVLRRIVDPYVQVVTAEGLCEWTGLRLPDIWRYFRHTWITTYQSTPGRKIFYLIRDKAVRNHPVIGIGALGSAIVQLSVRDEWIGWTGAGIISRLRSEPTIEWARWLDQSLETLLEAVLTDDISKNIRLTRRQLSHPRQDLISRLREISVAERDVHRLYPDQGRHKEASGKHNSVDWGQQARTHLFRSKRATALAELLEARYRLQAAGFSSPSVAQLRQALENAGAVRAIQTVLRYVKAAHVGVDMMDITVCGALAPYNRILGGKLVSLLMASPAVRTAYDQRYRNASSVIASSIAGRAVKRKPHLVLLGTTSLYGSGASQYNRLRVPAEAADGMPGEELAYVPLGRTAGYGSYHFSRETMEAIDPVLRRLQRGRPVNSIFGEGVNPKLRKIRSAFDTVGLPADLLLQHGSPRIVYGIPLASNFRDVLMGKSKRPQYIVPDDEQGTIGIVNYWYDRWLSARIDRPDVLRDVAAQSLAHPIQHDARVKLPGLADDEVGPLFNTSGKLAD